MNTREKLSWTLLGVASFLGIAAVSTNTTFFTNASLSGWLSLSGETNRLTVAGDALLLDGSAIGGGGETVWTNSAGIVKLAGGQAATNRLEYVSGAADNATNVAVIFDTAVTWSDPFATLVQFRNNGATNGLAVSQYGGFLRGDRVAIDNQFSIRPGLAFLSLDYLTNSASIVDRTVALRGIDTDNSDVYVEAQLRAVSTGTNSLAASSTLQAQHFTLGTYSQIRSTPTSIKHEMLVNGATKVQIFPTEEDGLTPHIFGTSVDHTSGNLFEVDDNGTDKFVVVHDGRVITQGGTGITPANASATGTAGTILWDANFIYIAVANNTWKRVAIATW